METIIETYARYAGENHDLAISLTAREINIEEYPVRTIIDAGTNSNFTCARPNRRNHSQGVCGHKPPALIGVLCRTPVQSRFLSAACHC